MSISEKDNCIQERSISGDGRFLHQEYESQSLRQDCESGRNNATSYVTTNSHNNKDEQLKCPLPTSPVRHANIQRQKAKIYDSMNSRDSQYDMQRYHTLDQRDPDGTHPYPPPPHQPIQHQVRSRQTGQQRDTFDSRNHEAPSPAYSSCYRSPPPQAILTQTTPTPEHNYKCCENGTKNRARISYCQNCGNTNTIVDIVGQRPVSQQSFSDSPSICSSAVYNKRKSLDSTYFINKNILNPVGSVKKSANRLENLRSNSNHCEPNEDLATRDEFGSQSTRHPPKLNIYHPQSEDGSNAFIYYPQNEAKTVKRLQSHSLVNFNHLSSTKSNAKQSSNNLDQVNMASLVDHGLKVPKTRDRPSNPEEIPNIMTRSIDGYMGSSSQRRNSLKNTDPYQERGIHFRDVQCTLNNELAAQKTYNLQQNALSSSRRPPVSSANQKVESGNIIKQALSSRTPTGLKSNQAASDRHNLLKPNTSRQAKQILNPVKQLPSQNIQHQQDMFRRPMMTHATNGQERQNNLQYQHPGNMMQQNNAYRHLQIPQNVQLRNGNCQFNRHIYPGGHAMHNPMSINPLPMNIQMMMKKG